MMNRDTELNMGNLPGIQPSAARISPITIQRKGIDMHGKLNDVRRRGRLGLRLGIAAGAAALTMCSPLTADATTAKSQSVLGSGSDTTQFMMQALDGLYLSSPGCAQSALDFTCTSPDPAGTVTTENYAHDQVHEAYFLGSSNGIKQLCTKGQTNVAPIDFARSSRAPKSSDCAGLHFVAYAQDAISWEAFDLTSPSSSGIHGMNNNVNGTTCAGSGSNGATQFCLTQSQLQGIFVTCTITNWNQVGGNNVPISIYTPQPGSGTRSTWDGFVGGDSSACIGKNGNGLGNNPTASAHLIPENSNTGIPTNDRGGAIFPFSRGVWVTQVHGTDGAVLGAVDNVSPAVSSIQDGSFPFSRSLFNVFCTAGCTSGGASSQATVNYVGEDGWICKAAQPPAAPDSDHAVNSQTGNYYHQDISSAISSQGFVPFPLQNIGGGDPNKGYCSLFTT